MATHRSVSMSLRARGEESLTRRHESQRPLAIAWGDNCTLNTRNSDGKGNLKWSVFERYTKHTSQELITLKNLGQARSKSFASASACARACRARSTSDRSDRRRATIAWAIA